MNGLLWSLAPTRAFISVGVETPQHVDVVKPLIFHKSPGKVEALTMAMTTVNSTLLPTV